MRIRMHPRSWLFVASCLSFAARGANAQTFPLDPAGRTEVAIQLEKPLLPDVLTLAAFSSIFEADAVAPIGATSALHVGFPIAFAGADVIDGTSVYAGNLRASLLFGEPGSLSSFIGVTLPTASNISGPDLAVLVGALPWLGESEKWMEDAWSVGAAKLPSWQLSSGGEMGLRLGGVAIMPTDFEDLWLDARVAGWGRFPMGRTELRADLATSYMVTSDDGFGDQFTAYLDLGASLIDMSGRPGVFLRVPLDREGRDVLDLSLGLNARF